ncbi:MAG: type I 3-dehydroquinate dehydratase [Verrucomicrobia bacterium]|nr:type I 3-dehydroquinate dehydratase [Verrucomicrobiota bacterium]
MPPVFIPSDVSDSSVVAVIASARDLEDACALSPGSFDICELRIDLFQHLNSAKIVPSSVKLPTPVIVTVRDPAEGGAHGLSEEERIKLFKLWLPACNYIDVELRNIDRFSALIDEAESSGIKLIISFHDFQKTPNVSELNSKLSQASLHSDRIFKVATRVNDWSDIENLVYFLKGGKTNQLAAMGMGSLGKLSRLILARLGSRLVYGCIAEEIAPGQWSVTKLRTLLREI